MKQLAQYKVMMYCKPQDFSRWKAALSFYQVSQASLDEPLEKVLAQAASDQTDLFVVLDGTQSSDDSFMSSVRAYMEAEHRPASDMRIAFVASRKRETPSYLFRVLANYDMYDIIVPPKVNLADFNPYVEVAQVITVPKCYSDVVAHLTGSIVNPKLIGLSASEELRERSRAQVRIAVAQIDQRRGGSTHTTLLLARTLVLLGYKVAVFLDSRTWKNLRRCYPRARCNMANGLISLSGIDFYRNEGFARVNGYDYVLADFGCARWIDLEVDEPTEKLGENFHTAQLAVLTSVVSPLGDHASFERVLKIWQRKDMLQNLGGVRFAFFGMPYDAVFHNWCQAAQQLNAKAELYRIPYLPNPLHYEPSDEGHCPELISILGPVLRPKDR